METGGLRSAAAISGSSRTDELARRFRDRTLAKAEWTHAAHLRVGLWHVLRFPPDEALAMLRDGIRALNESHGGVNTDDAGYHETITRFYVLWIGQFADRAGREQPIDDLAEVLMSAAGDSKLALRYYSRARLFSAQARRAWLAPDLAPISPA
jgi:hypothetical protein